MYEACEAPFCPLESNDLAIWYAKEEICRNRDHKNVPWVQAQRKIAKVAATGYFTLGMLNRNCIIKSGMQGLDPDHEERHQIQLWLKKHPEKQKITDENREKLRDLMKKNFDNKK